MLKVLSNKFSLVLEADKINSSMIDKYLTLNSDAILFWAYILHDADKLDNDDFKRPHFHLLLLLNKDRDKFAILKDLARSFVCETSAISIRLADNWRSCCLYLRHYYYNSNDDVLPINGKHQYALERVNVSNIGLYNQYCNGSVDVDYKDINVQTLLQFISLGYTFTEICLEIGIKNATKYRSLIKDLLDERYFISAIKDKQTNVKGIYSDKLMEVLKK